MQAVLNVIWDKLLPAFESQAQPINAADNRQLADRLAHLEVRTAQGSASTPLAGKILNRKFLFPANDQKIESLALSLSDSGKTLTLTARMDSKEVKIPCGYQQWKKSRAPLFVGKLAQFSDEPTGGAFAWPHDDTCSIKLCAYETPYHTMLTLKFEGDQMTFDSETNVAFGPTKLAKLAVGRTGRISWVRHWIAKFLHPASMRWRPSPG